MRALRCGSRGDTSFTVTKSMLNSEGEKKCNKQSDVTEAFKEEQKTFI